SPRPARRVRSIESGRRRSGEPEPQALLRSSDRPGPPGRPGGWHPPAAPHAVPTAGRASVRLRLPAGAVGPEGFDLGEQTLGLLEDRGDLAGLGRARGEAPEVAPGPLQAADETVEDGGIDHDRASVEGGPAARRSDRARSGTDYCLGKWADRL